MSTCTIAISAADNGGFAASVPVVVTVVSTAPGLFDGTGASLQRVRSAVTAGDGTLAIAVERTATITTDGSTLAVTTTTIQVGDEVYSGLTIPNAAGPVTLASLVPAHVDHTVAVTLVVDNPSEAAVAQLKAQAGLSVDSTNLSGVLILASVPVPATSDSGGLLTWHLDRTDQLTPVTGGEPYYTFVVGDSVYYKLVHGAGALASMPTAIPASSAGGVSADQTALAADAAVLTGAWSGPDSLQDELRQRFQGDYRNAGAWSNVVAYLVNDVVTLAGTYYACTAAHTGHTPPSGSFWNRIGLGTVTSVSGTAPVSVATGTSTPVVSVPPFVASGASHAAGLVPDPGGSAGSTRFLREDATFAVPSGTPAPGPSLVTPPAHLWRRAISPGQPAIVTQSTIVANGLCNAFPAITVSRTGAIFVAYRRAPAGINQSDSGDAVYRISRTGGAAGGWGSEVVLATHGTGHDLQPTGMKCTHTGRLLFCYWDYPGTLAGSTLYIAHSDDDGASWSSFTNLSPYTSASVGGGQIFEHSTGVLLLPVYGENSGDSAYRTGVLRSTDDGTSWSGQITIAGANTNYDEMALIELPNGSIMAVVRFESSSAGLYTSISTDVGLTWSGLTGIGFSAWGGMPGVGLFPVSGELVIFYRRVTDQHCAWRWSTDLGVTWSAEQTISTDGYDYAGIVALEDHLLGIVYAHSVTSTADNIEFLTMSAGVPVVAGDWAGNVAGKNAIAALAGAGALLDTTTLGTVPIAQGYAPLVLDNPGGTAPIFVVDADGRPIMVPYS